MSKKNQSFIKGAAILGGAGIIVKVIGAVFRIPLARIITAEGMGLYQMAYPIYALLLVASTAGLPVAVSKMVSSELAHGQKRTAHQVFKVSLKFLTIFGLITSITMFSLSNVIANFYGNNNSVYSIMAIAPALLFVSIMSAFRGYFQGMKIMTPTAISQIIEQLGKLIIGLTLAKILMPYGVEYGAAGAMIGVMLSEIAALVFLLGVYQRKKKEIWVEVRASERINKTSNKSIFNKLLKIAIPITIGAAIMPLVNFADAVIVVNRLKPTIDAIPGVPHNAVNFATYLFGENVIGQTYENVELFLEHFKQAPLSLQALITQVDPKYYIDYIEGLASSVYGLLTGCCNTLINFPAVLSLSIGMSLVPAISQAQALKDTKTLQKTTVMGIKITLLIGLPSAVGLITLAHPIINTLYGSYDVWEINMGAWILELLAIGVIFLTLVQSLTAILQGVGKVKIPVRNLFIGALVKVIVTYIFVGIPEWNARGAALGSVLCYGIAATLNLISVVKYTGINFNIKELIIKPLVSAVLMGAGVVLAYNTNISDSTTAMLGVSVIVGVVVYAVMLLILKAINKEELLMIPGGKKAAKVLEKFKLI